MPEYTEGVCEDGATILKDGAPMTVSEILLALANLAKDTKRNFNIITGFTREDWPLAYELKNEVPWEPNTLGEAYTLLASVLTAHRERHSIQADVQRLTRELDVAWNGKEGAAEQASLCDVVAQIKSELQHVKLTCTRCGMYLQRGRICDAEECLGKPRHSACEGCRGMCCDGGADYAKGQMP